MRILQNPPEKASQRASRGIQKLLASSDWNTMPDPRMLEFPTLLRPTLDDIRKADPSGGSDRFLPVTKQKGIKPERRGSGVYRDGPPTAFHDYSSPELRTTAKAFFLQPTPDVAGGPPPASHRKNDEPSEDGRGSAEEEEEAVVFSTDDKSWLAEEVALEREFGTEQISCREEGERYLLTVTRCSFCFCQLAAALLLRLTKIIATSSGE